MEIILWLIMANTESVQTAAARTTQAKQQSHTASQALRANF